MSTHIIPYTQKKEKTPEMIPNTIMSAAIGLVFLGTQERVQTSRGKRAINVRVSEVLLSLHIIVTTTAPATRMNVCRVSVKMTARRPPEK